LNASDFYDLCSGRKRGISPSLARFGLRLAETPYALAMRLRNWRFDNRPKLSVEVSRPVISVGNLTLGGTGKTPVVKWLARRLRSEYLRVAILSRGYGAEASGVNDEALELELALPDVPHLQDRDRVAIANIAIDELDMQVLLLDDGFQHRRLRRDFDLVLLDATEPFGFGHVFPRGALREPLSGLRRANAVCLTRSDAISSIRRQEIRRVVERYAPQALWSEARHAPQRLVNSSGETAELSQLAGQKVLACCGIGNPAAFQASLVSAGTEVVGSCEFPDHHNYSRDNVQRIVATAKETGADWIVTTCKDLVKLGEERLDGFPLWALAIEVEFLSGAAELFSAIRAACQAKLNREASQES
jgi:tetraacyldisaccharide 4'-kinase